MSNLNNRVNKLESSQALDEPNPLATLAKWAVAKVYNGIDTELPDLDENAPAVLYFLRHLKTAYGRKR